MNVLIGGGSGFIGTALAKALKKAGFIPKIISRKQLFEPNSLTWDKLEILGAIPKDTYAVINLSGANLSDFTKKWDSGYSKEVYDSRVNTTKLLASLIANSKIKPKVFITTSAVGIYPPSETAEYTEKYTGIDENDFFCRMCRDWEQAAELPSDVKDVRRVVLRLGLVLGNGGGLLKTLYWQFFFFSGGPTGSGKQYFPWIHIDDCTGIIMHALRNDHVTGVLNAVAPGACTNQQFAKAYGKALWRPSIFGTPSYVIKMLFDAERARLILSGQKVVPLRTLESGYHFKYADIDSACRDLAK